ncbi:MAG: hypothetical protein P4K94_07250 [Terracidiphilus sp.]|nr:hypothetical protein [Terracidiphilus sp.]
MKFIRWAVVATLTAMFHLHAQTPASVPPSPAPASGPTMEQTVAFINDTFAKIGEFHYNAGDEPSVSAGSDNQGLCAIKRDDMAVHAQSISISTDSTLTFTSSATKTINDTECVPDKHGKLVIDKATGNLATNVLVTKEEVLVRQELHLDALDPRTISVVSNEVVRTSIRLLTGKDTWPGKTIPETFSVTIKRPSSETKGNTEMITIGTFYDKDLADRVAKAYIHAIVLCHKPEAPSLF